MKVARQAKASSGTDSATSLKDCTAMLEQSFAVIKQQEKGDFTVMTDEMVVKLAALLSRDTEDNSGNSLYRTCYR